MSKRFSGNFIVQYNIWLKGNKKLKKKIIEQNINAKNDFDRFAKFVTKFVLDGELDKIYSENNPPENIIPFGKTQN